MFSCLSLLGTISPSTQLYCRTEAFSPSIPGQPLIFHTSNMSLSVIEKKILKKLPDSTLCQLAKLSELSQQMSEELIGLIGTLFLRLSEDQKQSFQFLYLLNINDNVFKINYIFYSSTAYDPLGPLLEETLTLLVQIVNQMLENTAIVPDNALFQQDYIQMQQQVINPFNVALTRIKDSEINSYLKAEAKSSLEALVSCLTLTISNTNSMVHGNNTGSRNLILARQQILKNLVTLIEATYALQVLTSKKCG